LIVIKHRKLLRAGIVGTTITLLCCFTPVVVVLFSIVGLSGWLGYLDYFLFPALAFFIGLSTYAIYVNKKNNSKFNASPANQQIGMEK